MSEEVNDVRLMFASAEKAGERTWYARGPESRETEPDASELDEAVARGESGEWACVRCRGRFHVLAQRGGNDWQLEAPPVVDHFVCDGCSTGPKAS